MLLENIGLNGTDDSHWSRKSIGNELMTATVVYPNPTMSFLTLALLESTGWYTRVSY
jgi:Fe2+ transport system protein B